MDLNNIKDLIEENKNLILFKESKKYPGLFTIRYRKKVFYEGLWNEFLEEARGLVIDKDYNIVVRPFKKIYNYGIEKEAPVLTDDKKVLSYRKINGFMLGVSFWNDQTIISTTGSLDSEFVDYGKYFLDNHPDFIEDCKHAAPSTYLFECVHPSDPHIVDETPGLYGLGIRYISDGGISASVFDQKYVQVFNEQFGFNTVEHEYTTIGELKEKVKDVKHEGFVFYTEDGQSAKIKSPYYLTKKILMRKNMDKLMSMDGKELLDEEFYPILNYIQEVDKDHYFNLDEQAKREYIEKWFQK